MAISLAQSLPLVNIFNLTPALPNLRCISHRRLLSISDNRCLYHLLIRQKFFFLLILRNILHKRQCILVLTLFINHRINTTYHLAYTSKFTLTDFLFAHIDELELDATFLEVTLGFLCIVALFRTKNLYVHLSFTLQSSNTLRASISSLFNKIFANIVFANILLFNHFNSTNLAFRNTFKKYFRKYYICIFVFICSLQ